jgi:hypothetical protein
MPDRGPLLGGWDFRPRQDRAVVSVEPRVAPAVDLGDEDFFSGPLITTCHTDSRRRRWPIVEK